MPGSGPRPSRAHRSCCSRSCSKPPYFCQTKDPALRDLATEPDRNPAIARLRETAAELQVVLPVSFYERDAHGLYNSVAMIDADGSVLGIYRKAHIPDGPGYEETFYFDPGDSGFCVWNTHYGRIGVGICWDQWFPEAARCMALMGAELLLFPTAIGSEPEDASIDSRDHWRTVMLGHAAANMIPVVASNRVGTEHAGSSTITFYGSSFIAGIHGEILASAGRTEETILTAELDLDDLARKRSEWGLSRYRRPDCYSRICQP